MMRQSIVRCVALATLGVLTACSRADAPVAGAASAPTKLRVVMQPHLSWGPLMIAQAEGFFKAEGIDVEPVLGLRGEESLAALVTGSIDVLPGPIHAGVLSAIKQGARIRIAAGQANLAHDGCTYFAIVLRPGLEPSAKTPIKRMRTSQDGATRFLVDRMLQPHGMSVKTVETIRIPEAVMVSSLERGSIDAVAVTEPALTRTAKVGRVWVRAQDAQPGFQWGVIVFGKRLLEKDHDAGVRFVRAYERGIAQYRQGKTPRNVAIIAAASGQPEDVTRQACWPTFVPGSSIDWESIAQFQRWANAEGLMEHTLTRDQVWDSTFVTRTTIPTP